MEDSLSKLILTVEPTEREFLNLKVMKSLDEGLEIVSELVAQANNEESLESLYSKVLRDQKRIMATITLRFINSILEKIESIPSMKVEDFMITNQVRKIIEQVLWKVVFYNKRGKEKFKQKQIDSGLPPSKWVGVQFCYRRSQILQKAVNELCMNPSLLNELKTFQQDWNKIGDETNKKYDKIEEWFLVNLEVFQSQKLKLLEVKDCIDDHCLEYEDDCPKLDIDQEDADTALYYHKNFFIEAADDNDVVEVDDIEHFNDAFIKANPQVQYMKEIQTFINNLNRSSSMRTQSSGSHATLIKEMVMIVGLILVMVFNSFTINLATNQNLHFQNMIFYKKEKNCVIFLKNYYEEKAIKTY